MNDPSQILNYEPVPPDPYKRTSSGIIGTIILVLFLILWFFITIISCLILLSLILKR
jgi:hypothetical protein